MTSQKTNTNLALKVAIVTSGFTQRAVAQKAGMSELRLSQLVNRRVPVTADDKRILAKVLRRRQSELFPEPETVVAS